MTVGAKPLDLDDFSFGNETVRAQGFLHRARKCRAFHLGGRLAAPTDQKVRRVVFGGKRAADEGIETCESVHQPVLHQKIERAVDRHGRDFPCARIQSRQNVIGPHGRMARPDGFQHPPANLGQPRPALGAEGLSGAHGIGRTLRMIVMRMGKDRRGSACA